MTLTLRHNIVAVQPDPGEEIPMDGSGHAVRAHRIANGLYLVCDVQVHGPHGTLLHDVHGTQGVVVYAGPECKHVRPGDRVLCPDRSMAEPLAKHDGMELFAESQLLAVLRMVEMPGELAATA